MPGTGCVMQASFITLATGQVPEGVRTSAMAASLGSSMYSAVASSEMYSVHRLPYGGGRATVS